MLGHSVGRGIAAFGFIVALTASSCTAAPIAPSAAPSASGPTRIPLVIDQEDPVGNTRFLFGMITSAGDSLGSPSLTVSVAFFDLAKSSTVPTGTYPATFIWAIPDVKGIYVVNPTFAEAGDWAADFTSTAAGLTETTRVSFPVSATSSTPEVGAKAPDTVTPTLADVGGNVKQLSTDTTPDPDFYRVSVHDALAQHKPFVLVFATPAFCTSRQCGPTLDSIKAIAKTTPGMTFINVEPYKMQYTNGSLQPILDGQNALQPTDVTDAWGLLTEPWIFVVDKTGVVRASYSLIVSADELKAAIAAVE
jgi:hypothetical protein